MQEQGRLARELEEASKTAVLQKHGLTKEKYQEIMREGQEKGWPKPEL